MIRRIPQRKVSSQPASSGCFLGSLAASQLPSNKARGTCRRNSPLRGGGQMCRTQCKQCLVRRRGCWLGTKYADIGHSHRCTYFPPPAALGLAALAIRLRNPRDTAFLSIFSLAFIRRFIDSNTATCDPKTKTLENVGIDIHKWKYWHAKFQFSRLDIYLQPQELWPLFFLPILC